MSHNKEDKNKPDAIIIDLEGTLSDHSHRKHLWEGKNYHLYNKKFIDDPVNENFLVHLKTCAGMAIIICTAKKAKYHEIVSEWLIKNELAILISDIHYRGSNDERSSVEVKKSLLTEVQSKYNVVATYDDREDICQMFAENGIKSYLVDKDGIYEYEIDIETVNINSNQAPRPDEILMKAAKLFKSRNVEYGNGYKDFGKIMMTLLPDGVEIKTAEDASRYAILNIMIAKFDRYCKNFHKGGHKDSLRDIPVYCAMLQEIDDDNNI